MPVFVSKLTLKGKIYIRFRASVRKSQPKCTAQPTRLPTLLPKARRVKKKIFAPLLHNHSHVCSCFGVRDRRGCSCACATSKRPTANSRGTMILVLRHAVRLCRKRLISLFYHRQAAVLYCLTACRVVYVFLYLGFLFRSLCSYTYDGTFPPRVWLLSLKDDPINKPLWNYTYSITLSIVNKSRNCYHERCRQTPHLFRAMPRRVSAIESWS